MNKRFYFIMMLGLLASCTGEEKPSNSDEIVDATVHVTGITLDQKQVTLKEGATVTLVPTIYPENATNKKVSWSSGDSAVATVEDGKVTAIKAGTTAIIAATEDGGKTAMCSVVVESNLAPAVTVGTDHISAVSVMLKGKANLGSTMSSDLKVGFQYSKSEGILPANSTTVDATEADANYNYSTVISGLEPGTTYYFRSFVRQNGMDTYGETKSFTAKELTSMLETLEATGVEADQAKLNAKLDLTDVGYKTLEYGFYWERSENSQTSVVKGGEITDAAYSVFMTGLSHKTQYWYKAYIKIDSQSFEGDVKSFTTDVVPVESITLDESEYTFNAIGSTRTLQAVILPSDATNKAIEWTSDNENVATVSAGGTVRSVGNGSATITATTVDQKKTASCTITVNQLVTGITLNKTSLTLNEGESQTLTATVSPQNANDSKIVWTSSDESVATVDENGTVTAVSKGSARIRAEANDRSGRYATCSVTVKRLVSGITLDKTSLIMYRGSTDVSENLTATVMPVDANDKTVRWSSSNTSVATVSSSGVVTGKSVGLATITVSARDVSGVEAKCEVEVRQYITSISLDKTSITLIEGQEQTLSATILPSNAYDKSLMWTSTDESVATVDGNGRVTAMSKGSATIKAEAKDGSGVFATCSVVTYHLPTAVDLGLSIKWADCNLGASSPEDYGDYYAWGEVEPKENYSWSTYKFGTSSSGPLSKYNTKSSYGTVDNKTVLDPEDDVAHVMLGGKWRMPTDEEWTELRTKCTWTWTDNYNGTGVKGRIVTATNGNSIFLPAAGYRSNTYLSNAGSVGMYWSSSLFSDDPSSAWDVGFGSSNVFRNDGIYRYSGQSVRPVSE